MVSSRSLSRGGAAARGIGTSLQLDPDDDDAEEQIRRQLEKRFERDLSKAFGTQLDTLLPESASDDTVRNAPGQVSATSEPVREVLRRNLESGAELGVTVASETLEQVGMAFDFNMANVRASKWASQYSYELIRDMNDTTQQRMQQAVNDWFLERSTTVRDLAKELEATFGRKRAQLIAITETSRAAAQGSITGYEQSGIVQEMEWLAAKGERTCPVCNGLHGERTTLRGQFPGGYGPPPAHPRCRCTILPVVETKRS
jgi:SPP1 gp7 family putative phage head morphogenesis protein